MTVNKTDELVALGAQLSPPSSVNAPFYCYSEQRLHEKEESRNRPGLEINEIIQSHFATGYQNLVTLRAAFSCQRLSKTKYEPAILVRKETAEDGE